MSCEMYPSYRLTHAKAVALLDPGNVFGSFEDFDEGLAMSPCRSIPVTAQMRRADAALVAERERRNVSPAMEWRAKAQLDDANLRTVKCAAAAPGRVAETRKIAVAKAGPRAQISCEKGCGRMIEVRSVHRVCARCRPHLGKLKACEGCGAEFNRWSPHATCGACRKAVAA